MSFGFGVGDFLAGASLAYKLYQTLSETQGSSKDYQSLTAKLLVVHKVLLQVEQLRAANQLAQSTLNAILFLTNGMNEAIGDFMTTVELYRESLQDGGSGNAIKDIFYKGKWAIKAPEAQKLSDTLNSNLLSLSILIQMACYFNTEYQPPYDAKFRHPGTHGPPRGFPGVKICATIDQTTTGCSSPEFQKVPDAHSFFRPGQVFSVEIKGRLDLSRPPHIGPFDWTRLPLWTPLSSISDPHEREKERYERQKRNFKAIQELPLISMFQYGTLLPNGRVQCTLCPNTALPTGATDDDLGPDTTFGKAFWADRHFRVDHHERFQELTKESRHISNLAQPYIHLEDMDADRPILSEEEVAELSNHPPRFISVGTDPWVGSILVRRLVVVRQGIDSCLCLGIHTYAGRGASDQLDQELFAVLHSSKDIPVLLENEINIKLKPVRLKAEHPSTALPSSARIHFGRVYEVKHGIKVKGIGLIHDSSMETLLTQFESHLASNAASDSPAQAGRLQADSSADSTVTPVNFSIVKEIRDSIRSVDNINSAIHKP
ncbi:hypothetical protein AbraIFM66951_012042 [Aspergillus brasiliensis]|uniref:DUF6590 domain-containing protein n=1 Tax=Aspergillus brasiliensis TaxID=319629 RepID=A0A9W5Z376_9EURO|nr:hypothetical protein AbraCBS73388_003280 [Aspergillus brasiliensis]GKZ48279.1 hypothetical protein AbraIFM66951_012042 [Aspergillus brasiliensis]